MPVKKLIKSSGSFYVYDSISNTLENIDRDSYFKMESNPELLQVPHQLQFCHLNRDKAEYLLKYKVDRLTIQLTQQCNLRCDYCPYSGSYIQRRHSDKTITKEVITRAIDFLAAHSVGKDEVLISFYGGEPLIVFDLIQYAVEYAQYALEGKIITWQITTNGVLLNREIIDYFHALRFIITVSLDGPKDQHDKHRRRIDGSGTFDTIMSHLEYLTFQYADIPENLHFNAVIDTTGSYRDASEFFTGHSFFKKAEIQIGPRTSNYLDGQIEYSEAYREEFDYEKLKYFLYKLDYLKQEDVSAISKSVYQSIQVTIASTLRSNTVTMSDSFYPSGLCVPGLHRLFVSVDGRFYICERGSECSPVTCIGAIETGLSMNRVMQLLDTAEITTEECSQCWALRFCSQCALSCDTEQGLSRERRLSACPGVQRHAEELLKDYIMFQELGHTFPAVISNELRREA